MSLLRLRNVGLGFGGPALFNDIDLVIERGERLCLVGRNGTGKSTLLKLLQGEIEPETGEIERRQGLRIARLDQSADATVQGTVFETAARGLGQVGELLCEYHRLIAADATPDGLDRLTDVQHDLEDRGGWQLLSRIDEAVSRVGLDADDRVEQLSGGQRRRALLARALVQEPDILLLDEPTNHLDIAAIEWLEGFLLSYRATLLFVTHDRAFLRKLATRIIELDRGRLSSWPGDYDTYLKRKQQALEAEATQDALFDKKLASEEVWIRQGIKARRTRNEGRVRALQKMRNERRARRAATGNVKMSVHDGERSGKLVIEAHDLSWQYEGRTLLTGFSTTIMRGDKVGVLGPNASGKTTLLRLLLGDLTSPTGRVKLGTNLQIAYFDQHRAALDLDKSVIDNISAGSEQVTINGRSKHVMSYLQDFLFAPDRARSPVRALSGGERNRLLLARMFSLPANLLVMDEPTNDLDVETLELLEDLLVAYTGTLLLVSHDRAFLDNVVTSTLAFEGDARVNEYVGGYSDWLQQRPADNGTGKGDAGERGGRPVAAQPSSPPSAPDAGAGQPAPRRKLSYKEGRELAGLPGRIESLEAELATLHAAMADSAFYQQDSAAITATSNRVAQLDAELAAAYARWEELEG